MAIHYTIQNIILKLGGIIMKNKIISVADAVNYIEDGMTVMIGGFLNVGTPQLIIDEIVSRNIKNLTLISNDTGKDGLGISKLIKSKCAKKVITSHIGTNPETGIQMNSGDLIVDLVPQGTIAERIRCAGAGIGGFLTPTGIGTSVAEGKQIITIDEKDYLLELPLKADVAIIKGSIVDKLGNIIYNGTSRNFNPTMATAADIVIVEAEQIVEPSELDPRYIMTQSLFVDYIVGGER